MLDRKNILLSIARCEQTAIGLPDSRACHAVVSAQFPSAPDQFQLPEPWRGDIVNAPILFVSSNPGWGKDDTCPKRSHADPEIVNYYEEGFPECFPWNIDINGCRTARPISFWSSVRARASELYGVPRKKIVPGRDFALTEVVHCKSLGEEGVQAAAHECFRRHFASIATLSKASVVVVFGTISAKLLDVNNFPQSKKIFWYGMPRLIFWLPHPNARTRRTFNIYPPQEIEYARQILRKFSSIGL